MLMILWLLAANPAPQGLPPHSVRLIQERTLFANDEPVLITFRLGNQRDAILRARKWPDLIASLEVRHGERVLPAKSSGKGLYKRSDSLGINAHRDFRVDLRRYFPDMVPGEVYEIHYEDESTIAKGKRIRIVNLPMPPVDRRFLVQTSMGDFTLELAPLQAPNHSRNFALLVAMQLYKNMIWHRVVPRTVIQTGDPLGTGEGGSGFEMTLETSPLLSHEKYALGMARGPDLDSASSQFYICLDKADMLDGKYTVFGKVVDGFAVVDAIGSVRTTGPSGEPPERPLTEIALISIDPIDD